MTGSVHDDCVVVYLFCEIWVAWLTHQARGHLDIGKG